MLFTHYDSQNVTKKKKKTDNHRTQVACVLYYGIMDSKPTRAAVSSLFPRCFLLFGLVRDEETSIPREKGSL